LDIHNIHRRQGLIILPKRRKPLGDNLFSNI
jgi:hypothetical protein